MVSPNALLRLFFFPPRPLISSKRYNALSQSLLCPKLWPLKQKTLGWRIRPRLNLIIARFVVVAFGDRAGGIDSGRIVAIAIIENAHPAFRCGACLL